jgi:hypothetical protein
MASSTQSVNVTGLRDQQQGFALLFGTVLVLLGVIDYSGMLEIDGRFLGIFRISPLVNLVHVLTGLLGLVLGRYTGGGTLFNKVGSVIYLVIFLVGVVMDTGDSDGGNGATNGLHLLLGIVVGIVGFGIGESRPR